jgi:hypothetical protein
VISDLQRDAVDDYREVEAYLLHFNFRFAVTAPISVIELHDEDHLLVLAVDTAPVFLCSVAARASLKVLSS